jgi:hypothetical protein
MAARLESSSKQYAVPLLLSERLFELLSPPARRKCRKVDVVTVKGSEVGHKIHRIYKGVI